MITPERYMEIRKLADDMIADCGGRFTEFADAINELTQEECQVLDLMVFECVICNQWSDVNEREENEYG